MENFDKIKSEFEEGMKLVKCRKCDCMKITLKSLKTSLSSNPTGDSSFLLNKIEQWLTQMEPIKYDCLGCQHCYPAVAWNLLTAPSLIKNNEGAVSEGTAKADSTNQQGSSSCNQDKKK